MNREFIEWWCDKNFFLILIPCIFAIAVPIGVLLIVIDNNIINSLISYFAICVGVIFFGAVILDGYRGYVKHQKELFKKVIENGETK